MLNCVYLRVKLHHRKKEGRVIEITWHADEIAFEDFRNAYLDWILR